MSGPEYRWRRLTAKQRGEWRAWRKVSGSPWHSPPHCADSDRPRFHVTVASFEHGPHIGHSPARLGGFARDLLALLTTPATETFAWCVLPNHYHVLIETPDVLSLLHELGRFHERTSPARNAEAVAMISCLGPPSVF